MIESELYTFNLVARLSLDCFRYLWLLPLRKKTADTVATAIYEDVIARISVPSAILTDLGGEFTGEVMERLYERLGITRLRTTGYHPQCDAKAERVHFSVHQKIVKFIGNDYNSISQIICRLYVWHTTRLFTRVRAMRHTNFSIHLPLRVL